MWTASRALLPGLFLIGLHLFFSKEALAFRLESSAFKANETLPSRYTCDGENLSPPLVWLDPPEETQSFVLIVDDPDAPQGMWVHWLVYDLPASVRELSEGVLKTETLPEGARQGMTDFQTAGYGGPCPPAGKPHRYFFKLYALKAALNLPPKATKADIFLAMNGSILAQDELVGFYERS